MISQLGFVLADGSRCPCVGGKAEGVGTAPTSGIYTSGDDRWQGYRCLECNYRWWAISRLCECYEEDTKLGLQQWHDYQLIGYRNVKEWNP